MPIVTPESSLPHTVDVFKLAVQGARLSGQIESAHLSRLGEVAPVVPGSVHAELEFFIGDEGFAEVSGSVRGEVSLSCQRCLGQLSQVLSGEFTLGAVRKDEDAVGLPRRLDPWLVDSESSDLHALIEDELLLNLPIVALHPSGACEPGLRFSFGEDESNMASNATDGVAGNRAGKDNPFQILEQLKKPR